MIANLAACRRYVNHSSPEQPHGTDLRSAGRCRTATRLHSFGAPGAFSNTTASPRYQTQRSEVICGSERVARVSAGLFQTMHVNVSEKAARVVRSDCVELPRFSRRKVLLANFGVFCASSAARRRTALLPMARVGTVCILPGRPRISSTGESVSGSCSRSASSGAKNHALSTWPKQSVAARRSGLARGADRFVGARRVRHHAADATLSSSTGFVNRACGDRPLPPYGCCCSARNLTRFGRRSFGASRVSISRVSTKSQGSIRRSTTCLENVVAAQGAARRSAGKTARGLGFTGLATR